MFLSHLRVFFARFERFWSQSAKLSSLVIDSTELILGNIKNRPLGPDFSYGSPGQAKLLQKQKLSIVASLGIK